MEGLIIKIAISSGVIAAVFVFSYYKGKEAQKNQQLQKGIENAIKTKKRRSARRSDNINTVRKRMQKYIR